MDNDASPESFYDANQTIPEATPSTATHDSTSITNSSFSTLSPLHQEAARQLFPARNTNNESAAPPQYLTRTSSEVQVSLNMNDVLEEEAEHGDSDSIADAIELAELEEALDESIRDRLLILIKNEGSEEEEVSDCNRNHIILKKGLDKEVSMPSVPDDWMPPVAKAEKGEPLFESVDSPGEWPQFTYRPKFLKNKNQELCSPFSSYWGGARPVPVDPQGKRVVDEWELHYQKWNQHSASAGSQSGATSTNTFPNSRKGRLDYELLKQMKLTKKRIVEGDALFFLQLLLPIGDPKKSGIENDPRLPYYSQVERWTQKYATSIGLGGSYGYSFKESHVRRASSF
jgi:hypothetical protein